MMSVLISICRKRNSFRKWSSLVLGHFITAAFIKTFHAILWPRKQGVFPASLI